MFICVIVGVFLCWSLPPTPKGKNHVKWYIHIIRGLAAFLCIVRGDQSANKEYSNWAAKLFIQKNGKPSSSITLNQPDFDAVKEYKEIFNNAGIKR